MIIPGAIRFNVAAIDQKVAASTYSNALTRVDATGFNCRTAPRDDRRALAGVGDAFF